MGRYRPPQKFVWVGHNSSKSSNKSGTALPRTEKCALASAYVAIFTRMPYMLVSLLHITLTAVHETIFDMFFFISYPSLAPV